MSEGATVRLVGDQTRRAACQLVMRAPDGWVVRLDRPGRTLRQSSKFWATCGDVTKAGTIWGNHQPDKQGWHNLFLSGWNIAKGHPWRLMIGLEGELVSMVPHSRSLSEVEMSDLLDYTVAWATMHDIELRE